MRSQIYVIDDWSDSDHLHKLDGPLASLMCRGRHMHAGVILSTQKLSKLSTVSRCNANMASVFAFHSHQDAEMFINEYGALASEEGKDGRDNLRRLLAYATREPHSFLTILFKNPPEKRFMLRFESYLTINYDRGEPGAGDSHGGAERANHASQPAPVSVLPLPR